MASTCVHQIVEILFTFLRSTYATTVRDSKRARERDFLKAVSSQRIFLVQCFVFMALGS